MEDFMLTNERSTIQVPRTTIGAQSVGSLQNDERIATRAIGALEREKLLPDLRVRLSVEHGWLTLSGSATHGVERSAAECVVRYVHGVTGVTNDIVVVTAAGR
jgi:osmotically-inducible protein OsmY